MIVLRLVVSRPESEPPILRRLRGVRQQVTVQGGLASRIHRLRPLPGVSVRSVEAGGAASAGRPVTGAGVVPPAELCAGAVGGAGVVWPVVDCGDAGASSGAGVVVDDAGAFGFVDGALPAVSVPWGAGFCVSPIVRP
ncbi:hypothetical protein [Actinomadura sp. CNU-125]|uniref:hypothetical protein n=1 Tax=Actinomadura sp. CNU-125 TaxID=1904961 RepID=UPI001301066F|nr:hypothetical protein [Actinomadura sp. CNU-125]